MGGLVSTRMFMLAFVFSRMLNPLSYSVFLVMFTLFYFSAIGVIPSVQWHLVGEIITHLYVPLLFIRFLLFVTAIAMFATLVISIICFGKVIIKRATFSLILALCILHIVIFFVVNRLPITLSYTQSNHELNTLFIQTPVELITTIIFGVLLSLYCGVLARERFKKDIGFIDDNK